VSGQIFSCTEALRTGGVVLGPDEWSLLYGLIVAALATAVSKVACDAMEANGPPFKRK